jgi:antitoxin (DNA-binding transcriptional repressor) of toxin-antitoxin stability system
MAMKRVGAYEAKTHLPALLKGFAEEADFHHGKGVPVAMLVPAARGQGVLEPSGRSASSEKASLPPAFPSE